MEWGILAGIPSADVRDLIASARRRSFQRNEVLFHEQDPADTLHLIAKGRVAVQKTTALGKTVILSIRSAGQVVGEMALVGEPSSRSATVTALEPTETFAVRRDAFDTLRRSNPSLNEVLIGILEARVRELDDQLAEALYLAADVRVRRRVLSLADIYAADDGAPIPVGQTALAELAGTTRATVNRVLREEEERGSIMLGRSKITVLDRASLERRARG